MLKSQTLLQFEDLLAVLCQLNKLVKVWDSLRFTLENDLHLSLQSKMDYNINKLINKFFYIDYIHYFSL